MRIGELSRRVGVSTHLLRAWESRYGLLRPVRSPGGYRLYGPEDERRVRAVLEQQANGKSAASACRAVLSADRRLATPGSDPSPPGDPDSEVGLAPEITAFLDAVAAFDEDAAQAALDHLSTALPFDEFVGRAIMPALEEIGEAWHHGALDVAQEHFASQLIRQRLATWSLAWSTGTGPVALLACPPGERHDLALLSFGVLAARRGWRVRFLGADTPLADLVSACDRIHPELVVISASTTATLERAKQAITALAARHTVALGGRGATPEFTRSVGAQRLPNDVVEAANTVTAARSARGKAGTIA